MDISKIQRALGFIEGVCEGLPDRVAELIEEAITEIDLAIDEPEVPCGCEKKEAPAISTNAEQEELVERLYGYLRKCSPGASMEMWKMAEDCARAASLIEQLREQLKDREYGSYMERL